VANSPADPLAALRRQVRDAMRAAGKDSPSLERDLARQPESQLQLLLRHYGGSDHRYLW